MDLTTVERKPMTKRELRFEFGCISLSRYEEDQWFAITNNIEQRDIVSQSCSYQFSIETKALLHLCTLQQCSILTLVRLSHLTLVAPRAAQAGS